jgi:hypothetical protein
LIRRLDRAQSFTVVSGSVILVVPLESLLIEEDVLLRQNGITAERGYNFLSDSWIVLKILPEFQEAHFLVLPIESQLVDEVVLSSQTSITAQKGYNF